MEVVSGDNWSYKSCNAPVKSSPPTNQQTVSLQAGCPSCRPTNSVKALKRKYHTPWTCLPQAHLGGFSSLPVVNGLAVSEWVSEWVSDGGEGIINHESQTVIYIVTRDNDNDDDDDDDEDDITWWYNTEYNCSYPQETLCGVDQRLALTTHSNDWTGYQHS